MSVEGFAPALLLAAVGFVASTLNAIAGGGSFLVLPVLIFLGLPAADANGTNRVGLLLQNVGAVWGFQRLGVLDWRYALRATVPALCASLAGAWLALRVGDLAFRRVLAYLMVAITIWSLLDPLAQKRAERTPAPAWLTTLGFLVVGFYTGFVQAGVGFLILAVTTLAGIDLVRGNAIKVTVILVLSAATLVFFSWHGHVHWRFGAALAAGSLAGGLVGARLTVRKGQRFVKAVVSVTVLVFAVQLWWGS